MGVPAPMSVLRFIIWGFSPAVQPPICTGVTIWLSSHHLVSKVLGLRNQCYTVIAVNNKGVTSYSESGVSASKGISQILHSF